MCPLRRAQTRVPARNRDGIEALTGSPPAGTRLCATISLVAAGELNLSQTDARRAWRRIGRVGLSGYNDNVLTAQRLQPEGIGRMGQVPEITVRRARPSDAERIAAFVNRARPQGKRVTREAVVARLGKVGFLIAEADGEIVGLLGWQVENLIARVADFMISPNRYRVTAGHALLTTMEQAAHELQAEAAILFVPADIPREVLAFWEAFGYGFREVASLPRAWREAAREAYPAGEWVVLKQLRQDRVLRPM